MNDGGHLDDQFYKNTRARVVMIAFSIAVLLLVFRLFYLQIFQGPYHERLSAQNFMRLKVLHAPRGLILDRNDKVIARNRASHQIAILPTELKEPEMVFQNLMRFRDTTGQRIFDSTLVKWSMERGRWRRFQPLVILEDASPELVAMIEEHQLDVPGVITLAESRRAYPYGSNAAHIIGYMDEIKEDELAKFALQKTKQVNAPSYSLGNRIGRKGLEKYYERYFRGRDGVRYVKVNAYGKELEVLDDMPQLDPVPGHNLVTTLDMELQSLAESLIPDSVRGSIVALDPRNGDVLVMMSSPKMDGNIFSLSKDRRSKEWARLALDSAMPLNNRAIQGGYEPASTFKSIVSLAAFQQGVSPEYHPPKRCIGGFQFGRRFQRCWKPSGHGSTGFYEAFRQSCDVYYYQIGLDIGMRPINEVASNFGFGRLSGIDLEDERRGLLMDSVTYNRRFESRRWRWTPGIILNLSIGQGQIATPIQLANFTAGMVNGRYIYKPHLIREVRDNEGNTVVRHEPEILSELKYTPQQHKIILNGLDQVVNSPFGTAGRAAVPGVVVGGKTGSAENPHGEFTHALFVGAAPLYNPEIVIAVVLENVGYGGSHAAPIAGEIFRYYFKRKADTTQSAGL